MKNISDFKENIRDMFALPLIAVMVKMDNFDLEFRVLLYEFFIMISMNIF